jgi:YesN/AraC family two-component response regulator
MIEILVVEDEQRAGNSFATTIRETTGLDTVYTDNPDKAIEIAKSNHLKVAVLDQQMPRKSGTDLFRELREIEPDLRGILFSGKAKFEDLTVAIRDDICEFINKNDVAKLPERVMAHYFDALADISQRAAKNPTRLSDYRSGFSWRGPRVQLELLSIMQAPEEEKVVLDADFKTFLRLDVGETKKESASVRLSSEVLIEQESVSKLSSSAALKYSLISELKAAVETSQREAVKERVSQATERVTEQTYTLPPDPAWVEPSVRARHLQAAPIYKRVRMLVRTNCECCGMTRHESIYALVPTGDIRTRQVDYLSDNTTRIITTG